MSDTQTSRATSERSGVTRAESAPSPSVALAAIAAGAVTLRARRRQRLPVTHDQPDSVYVLRSGMMLLQAHLPCHRRQVLDVLYPGDIYRTLFAPPLPEAALVALPGSVSLRLRATAFEDLAALDPQVAAFYSGRIAHQTARQALHAGCIGGLRGEERVVTFLVEIAMRLGRPAAGGMAFDLPLSRDDIAGYLGLNADTLSRIMSRLKAQGLLTQSSRSRAFAPDWRELCRATPLADTLTTLNSIAAAV